MTAGDSLAIGDRGAASFALAFAITQLVEVPIYLRALRGARGSPAPAASRAPAPAAPPSPPRAAQETPAPSPASTGTSLARRAAIAFGASALTHPIVWFVMPWAAMALYRAALRAGGPALDETGRTLVYGGLAEGFAVLAEALYLRGFRVRRPLRWSLLANAASVIVGTIVVRLL